MWDGALNIFKNPESRKTVAVKPIVVQSEEVAIDNRPVETPVSSVPLSSCNGNEVTVEMLSEYWGILAAEESDISRLDRAHGLPEVKCLKVVQVAGLVYLFKSEYQRLQFVKFASYFLHDPENKLILADLFQYENMRAEVAQM